MQGNGNSQPGCWSVQWHVLGLERWGLMGQKVCEARVLVCKQEDRD